MSAPVPFLAADPEVSRRFGGDGTVAMIFALICIKAHGGWDEAYERDGVYFWRASYQELADLAGTTYKRARRAVDLLIEAGMISAAQHGSSTGDQTNSYRIGSAEEVPDPVDGDHLPEGADAESRADDLWITPDPSAPQGRDPLPHRAALPLIKNPLKKPHGAVRNRPPEVVPSVYVPPNPVTCSHEFVLLPASDTHRYCRHCTVLESEVRRMVRG